MDQEGASQVAQWLKTNKQTNKKQLPATAGDVGSIPGSGRSFGEGNGKPLQYCCLGSPTDREACGAIKSMGLQRSQT